MVLVGDEMTDEWLIGGFSPHISKLVQSHVQSHWGSSSASHDVGGFNLPLWKMMEFGNSWDDDIPNIMERHKSHVPNHQPVILFFSWWMD